MKSEEKQRPGVMLYFDNFRSLKRLSAEERGELFTAILEYAEYAIIPDFEKSVSVAILWDTIMPNLEKDAARYAERCAQSKYAVYCREYKKRNGKDAPSFEEWMQGASNDNERYPTTTTTTIATTDTISETNSLSDTDIKSVSSSVSSSISATESVSDTTPKVVADTDKGKTTMVLTKAYQSTTGAETESLREEKLRQLKDYKH